MDLNLIVIISLPIVSILLALYFKGKSIVSDENNNECQFNNVEEKEIEIESDDTVLENDEKEFEVKARKKAPILLKILLTSGILGFGIGLFYVEHWPLGAIAGAIGFPLILFFIYMIWIFPIELIWKNSKNIMSQKIVYSLIYLFFLSVVAAGIKAGDYKAGLFAAVYFVGIIFLIIGMMKLIKMIWKE